VRCRRRRARLLPTVHKPASLIQPRHPRRQTRQLRKRLGRRPNPGHRVSGNCGEARIGLGVAVDRMLQTLPPAGLLFGGYAEETGLASNSYRRPPSPPPGLRHGWSRGGNSIGSCCGARAMPHYAGQPRGPCAAPWPPTEPQRCHIRTKNSCLAQWAMSRLAGGGMLPLGLN